MAKSKKPKLINKLDQLDLVPFLKGKIIENVLIFLDYSRHFKTKILYFMDIIDLQRNQIIYNENSKAEDLYFIIRGEFEVKTSTFDKYV